MKKSLTLASHCWRPSLKPTSHQPQARAKSPFAYRHEPQCDNLAKPKAIQPQPQIGHSVHLTRIRAGVLHILPTSSLSTLESGIGTPIETSRRSLTGGVRQEVFDSVSLYYFTIKYWKSSPLHCASNRECEEKREANLQSPEAATRLG